MYNFNQIFLGLPLYSDIMLECDFFKIQKLSKRKQKMIMLE